MWLILAKQAPLKNEKDEMWYKPLNNLVESKDEDSIRVECARLDNLLEKHNITKVDLISIDVEGYELNYTVDTYTLKSTAEETFDFEKCYSVTDLGKSFVGFKVEDNEVISTGRWGCGVFKG